MIKSKSLPHPFQEVLRKKKRLSGSLSTYLTTTNPDLMDLSSRQVTKEVCVAKVTEGKRKNAV